MSESEAILAEERDPEGRRVVLLTRIWTLKIGVARPELLALRDDVMLTVRVPDHREDDPRDDRVRSYRRRVGPSRWLVVVVSYEQEPARIITAFASRKDPPQWIE